MEKEQHQDFGYLQMFADELLELNEDFTFEQVRELYLKILISDFDFNKHLAEKHGLDVSKAQLVMLRTWAFTCGISSGNLTKDLDEAIIDLL